MPPEAARRLAEEYDYEEEQAKIQQEADAAMARSMRREEANEARQKRRGADRKCPSEELREHVEAESERKLKCEARGYEYVPIYTVHRRSCGGRRNGPIAAEDD